MFLNDFIILSFEGLHCIGRPNLSSLYLNMSILQPIQGPSQPPVGGGGIALPPPPPLTKWSAAGAFFYLTLIVNFQKNSPPFSDNNKTL